MVYPKDRWKAYIKYGRKYNYDANVTIYTQGEQGKGFFYLYGGKIINRFLSITGKERYVNHISSGMLFGEEGSNGSNYLSTATTTVSSTVYYFSEQALQELCQEIPEAASTFVIYQVESFRKKLQVIQWLDSSVESQMKFYLAKQSSSSSRIPVNQTIIASDLSTSRVTVNKIIRKWQAEGQVELIDQVIHILNKESFYQEIK